MRRPYRLILDFSVSEPYFVLSCSNSKGSTDLPGRTFYSERLLLERDLKACLNANEALTAISVLRLLRPGNSWSADVHLTDEGAAHLGWQQ
jgi:hypothetical protein